MDKTLVILGVMSATAVLTFLVADRMPNETLLLSYGIFGGSLSTMIAFTIGIAIGRAVARKDGVSAPSGDFPAQSGPSYQPTILPVMTVGQPQPSAPTYHTPLGRGSVLDRDEAPSWKNI